MQIHFRRNRFKLQICCSRLFVREKVFSKEDWGLKVFFDNLFPDKKVPADHTANKMAGYYR